MTIDLAYNNIFMFAIITLPSPGELWTGVSAWSGETFIQFLPWAFFAIGIFVGGMLISYFVRVAVNGMARLVGGGNSEESNHGYFESAEYKKIIK